MPGEMAEHLLSALTVVAEHSRHSISESRLVKRVLTTAEEKRSCYISNSVPPNKFILLGCAKSVIRRAQFSIDSVRLHFQSAPGYIILRRSNRHWTIEYKKTCRPTYLCTHSVYNIT